MPKESRLVREVYFISPEYSDSHGKVEVSYGSCTERVSTTRIPDENDIFEAWLRENTLRFRTLENHSRFGGRLMGTNGVLCEIVPILYHDPEKSKSKFMIPGTYGAYHQLIHVSATPASKELPKELTDVLEEKGYKELSQNHKINNYGGYDGDGKRTKSFVSEFFK